MDDKAIVKKNISSLSKHKPAFAQGLKTIGTYMDAVGDSPVPCGYAFKILSVALIQAAALVDPDINSDPKLDEIKQDLRELKDEVKSMQQKLDELVHMSGVSKIREQFRQLMDYPDLDLTTWASYFKSYWSHFRENQRDFRKENLEPLLREAFEKEENFERLYQLYDQFQEARFQYFLVNMCYIRIEFQKKEERDRFVDWELQELVTDWKMMQKTAESILPPFFPIKFLDQNIRKKFGYVPHIETSDRNRQGKINWYRMLVGRLSGKLHSNTLIMYGEKLNTKAECFRRLFSLKDDEEEMTVKMNYKSLADGPFMKKKRDHTTSYGFTCWNTRTKVEVVSNEKGGFTYYEKLLKMKQAKWLTKKEKTFGMEKMAWGQEKLYEVYAHDGDESEDEVEEDCVDGDSSDLSDLEELDGEEAAKFKDYD